MISGCKRRQTLWKGAPRKLLWVLVTAIGFTPAGVHASNAEHRFRWDQANARMMEAASPEAYRGAAREYTRLAVDGVRNGPLFFNQGVAWWKAGDHVAAQRSFLRAERYLGTTPAIRHNLIVAMAPPGSEPTSSLPWYRMLLFWHYGLGISLRVAIALGGVSLLILAFAARLCRLRKLAACLHVMGVVITILFGSSAAASWQAERRDQALDRTALVSLTGDPRP